MTRSAGIPSSNPTMPPWPIVLICTLVLLAIGAISWPGFSGPCKDYRLNKAIFAAADRSFAPEALAEITILDLHNVKIRTFEGIQSCPNLERLFIHQESTEAWRTWAESQFSTVDPLTPDVRPTLPLLPSLREVTVGKPEE